MFPNNPYSSPFDRIRRRRNRGRVLAVPLVVLVLAIRPWLTMLGFGILHEYISAIPLLAFADAIFIAIAISLIWPPTGKSGTD